MSTSRAILATVHGRRGAFAVLLILILVNLGVQPLLASINPLLPRLHRTDKVDFDITTLLATLPIIAVNKLTLTKD